MTPAQIEKIGLPHLKDRKFWLPGLEREIKIPDYYSISDIYKMVYDFGFEDGIIRGKNEKVAEIKRVLEPETEW
jgi:hypothetical protein